MKTKRLGMALLTAALMGANGYAQDDVGSLISTNIEDSKILIKGYFEPFGKAFATGLNGGWYNTARVHKLGRFDFGVTLNNVSIPSEATTFVVSNLSNIRLTNANDNVSPTIFGSDQDGPDLEVFVENPLDGSDYTIGTLTLPPGLNTDIAPVPVPQFSIGLVGGTELMVRYLPTISVPGDDITADIDFWGVGLKHDIKQWFYGLEDMPFDLAIMAGYTRFNMEVDLDLKPEDGADIRPSDASLANPGHYNDQQMKYDVNAFTANLLISKKLSVLTFYGGLGYGMGSTNLQLLGNYPVTSVEVNGQDIQKVIVDFTDPIDMSTGDISNFRANLGMRLKLAFLTIHGDYTFSEYNMLTAGVGFNFDWGDNRRRY